jgi:nucleotide-binding universal stress UspA family protein
VDFSEFSRHALDHAVAVARRYGSEVTALHVFAHWPAAHVIPSLRTGVVSGDVLTDAGRAELSSALQEFVAGSGKVVVRPVVTEAPDVVREILEQAAAFKADLIVIGSHGRSGFERFLLGSVTEKVIRLARCPVMVVPARAPDADPLAPVRFNHVLCAVDGSPSAARALAFGAHLAEEQHGRITVLHVVELPPELQEVPASGVITFDGLRAAARAEWGRRLTAMIPASRPVPFDTVVVEGRVHREIVRLARDWSVDLIVMGAEGRSAAERWPLGSNAQHVVRAASCPVLTLRAAATPE